MLDKPSNDGPHEDARLADARQLLAESRAIEHRGDGRGSARMWSKLENVLGGVLDFVDETGRAGQLDRIETAVTDMAANRSELTDTLTAVRDALGGMVDRAEQLGRVERDIARLRSILGQAVAEEINRDR